MEGWIKIHRKVFEWRWYTDPNTFRLFVHLLLKATSKSIEWQKIELLPGQLITGRKVLSHELKLSEREIRTSLNKLKATSEIAIKSTNKYSVITICNWTAYQQSESYERPTERPTESSSRDQQETTYKNDKNIKNNISVIFDDFRRSYPGTKRGLGVELKEFIDKNKRNSEEIVHLLMPALEREKQHHKDLVKSGMSEPYWKNLKTWINQSCWEQEFPVIKSNIRNAKSEIIPNKEWAQ